MVGSSYFKLRRIFVIPRQITIPCFPVIMDDNVFAKTGMTIKQYSHLKNLNTNGFSNLSSTWKKKEVFFNSVFLLGNIASIKKVLYLMCLSIICQKHWAEGTDAGALASLTFWFAPMINNLFYFVPSPKIELVSQKFPNFFVQNLGNNIHLLLQIIWFINF